MRLAVGPLGPALVTQAEAEAGSLTAPRLWTPQRVRQGIAALETPLPADVSQAEAEAGTGTANRLWTPQRVSQAIAALASGGKILQRVYASTNAVITCSSAILQDDTKPQITEGTQVLSVSITPASVANFLLIRFLGWGYSNVQNVVTAAVFVGAGANAIFATSQGVPNSLPAQVGVLGRVTPSSTSPQTWQVRLGPSSGAFCLNGSGGLRRLGGASYAALVIDEVSA